jgi:hypothetical protein
MGRMKKPPALGGSDFDLLGFGFPITRDGGDHGDSGDLSIPPGTLLAPHCRLNHALR